MQFYQAYTCYTLSETLLVIGTFTPVHSCGNSEVMHSLCVHIIIRYTFRYCILLVIVGFTTLVCSCRQGEVLH